MTNDEMDSVDREEEHDQALAAECQLDVDGWCPPSWAQIIVIFIAL